MRQASDRISRNIPAFKECQGWGRLQRSLFQPPCWPNEETGAEQGEGLSQGQPSIKEVPLAPTGSFFMHMMVTAHVLFCPTDRSDIWESLSSLDPVAVKENVFSPRDSLNLSQSMGGRVQRCTERMALEAEVWFASRLCLGTGVCGTLLLFSPFPL